jgi:small multidrug resistance family-3 protein
VGVIVRSGALFLLAAVLEIGGAWLVWRGVREHRGWAWVGAGALALALYGLVATAQPDAAFGRVLAAYGGVFIAGSLLWTPWPTASGPTGGTSAGRSSAWSASR